MLLSEQPMVRALPITAMVGAVGLVITKSGRAAIPATVSGLTFMLLASFSS